jgi:multidrug efflux system outer membrane protein
MTTVRPLAFGLCLALASCSVGPDYARPPVPTPASYKSAGPDESTTPAISRQWWKLFGDPTLDRLEEAAIEANQDLQAALARVTQARAAAKIAGSQRYPTVTADPGAQRFRTSAHGTRAGVRLSSVTVNDFQVPIDFAYEVDVWGRVRRSVEAADAEAQASEADLMVVLQSVQADLAQNYFTLRSLDAQAEILKRTVEVYRRQLTLLETQLRAGLVGRITVVQQETQLYFTTTQEIDVRRQRADVEHAIAVLIGRPPSDLTLAAAPLDLAPPKVPAGLPSELLRRRPDVAQAERLLAAANARIGVATAQYYPAFQLTGQAGFESVDLKHLFDWESRIWAVAASAFATLFAGGRIDAAVEQSKAAHQEALAAYRGRVLAAFRDVEDSLTDLHLRADATEAQAKAVAAAREYVALSETQYKQGLVGYLQVTDAQRSLLVNELTAAQLLNQRLGSTVLLIKALGAGWDAQRPPEPAE